MASLTSIIEIQNQLRPCLVRVGVSDEKGDLKKELVKALFHEWVNKSEVVGASPLRGGHPGGQLSMTFALVEYEDGNMDLVLPSRVKFLDTKYFMDQYSFEGVRNDP